MDLYMICTFCDYAALINPVQLVTLSAGQLALKVQ